MRVVGYEFLRQRLQLGVPPPRRTAIVRPVTRILTEPTLISVPANVAPDTDDLLDHILFALKHEGTNLQVLATALPHVPAERLREELRQTPNGRHIRVACYLWERLGARTLHDATEIPAHAPRAQVFDPELYFTLDRGRDARWRVSFNGLGTERYCVTIEKTPQLVEALANDVLERTAQFAAAHKGALLDRALEWAYLHETRDSFAIEREEPGPNRERRFVSLLHAAHDGRPLDEDYLVELQNATISNPLEQASEYRQAQNHLSNGRGPVGVTYVPPAPALCRELMDELTTLVNKGANEIPPVLLATIAKFGFVFLHPFMDGNGRLSRFLFHKALCLSGRMQNGLLLPVSTAMHRNEPDYLAALQSFSRPTRQLWSVTFAGEDAFDFEFQGSDAVYRFWDATHCAEFGARMADQALEHELMSETQLLRRYDHILREVTKVHDVRSTLLNPLILGALTNDGTLSNNKRKRVAGLVPEPVLTLIETLARRELNAPQSAPEPAPLEPELGPKG